jgi:hypothetical protein
MKYRRLPWLGTRMEGMQNCGEKPIWKRRKWEDNAKMHFKKTGCEDGRWMALARERGDRKPCGSISSVLITQNRRKETNVASVSFSRVHKGSVKFTWTQVQVLKTGYRPTIHIFWTAGIYPAVYKIHLWNPKVDFHIHKLMWLEDSVMSNLIRFTYSRLVSVRLISILPSCLLQNVFQINIIKSQPKKIPQFKFHTFSDTLNEQNCFVVNQHTRTGIIWQWETWFNMWTIGIQDHSQSTLKTDNYILKHV